MVGTSQIVARYVLSKVGPLTIDQDRLRKWFGHILQGDKILDDIIISGSKNEMIVRVNSEKRKHSAFRLQFEITPELTSIRIVPKITAIG
jgi:hypothetical protein